MQDADEAKYDADMDAWEVERDEEERAAKRPRV